MRPNMMIATAAALLSVALYARPAAADESCDDAKSTLEMVDCFGAQTSAWDRRLNAAYQKLLASLPAARRERLRNAQRLWVQFRDANCGYFASADGSIARVLAAQCLYRLTKDRAQELEGDDS